MDNLFELEGVNPRLSQSEQNVLALVMGHYVASHE